MRKEYTKVQYNENGKKQCTNCKEYKNTSDFHKYSKAQDKLKPFCKVCVKSYDMIENDATRIFPRKLDENGNIHCRNCGGYFPEDQMDQSKNTKYLKMSYCNTCAPLLKRTRNVERYGLTMDQYHKMLQDQDYKCKLCGMKEDTFRKRLSIDHDHSCCPGSKACGNCIRGLLCHRCNLALGAVNDDTDILNKMIEYLKK